MHSGKYMILVSLLMGLTRRSHVKDLINICISELI